MVIPAADDDGVLVNARLYLGHVRADELAADPVARFRVLQDLMNTARDLRLAGVHDVLATMSAALGMRLEDLGVRELLPDIVASDQGGQLVGGVLQALEAKAEAERATIILETLRAEQEAETAPKEQVFDLAPAVLVRVSAVRPERVSWMWDRRVPRGKITVLDGDPGLGKSTLTLDLAARLSRGRPMPGEGAGRTAEGAVIMSAEDGIGDTIRPRLEAAGADLDRVSVLTAARDKDGRPVFPSLPDAIDALRWAVRHVGAGLLVVDPLMAYLSARVDSHRDQDVRGVLARLAEMAEDLDVATIIVRHLNKTSQGGHPIYRGGGSIGIIGAARAGLMVGVDPKDESRRILAVSKSNLGPIPPSLAYRLVPVGETAAVSWEGESSLTASGMLAAGVDRGNDDPGRDAEDFLETVLGDGPMLSADLEREAADAGISWATVRRAKSRLSVRATKRGGRFGGDPRWYWELRAQAGPPEGAHGSLKALTQEGEHLQGVVSAFSAEKPPGPPNDALEPSAPVISPVDAEGDVVLPADEKRE